MLYTEAMRRLYEDADNLAVHLCALVTNSGVASCVD